MVIGITRAKRGVEADGPTLDDITVEPASARSPVPPRSPFPVREESTSLLYSGVCKISAIDNECMPNVALCRGKCLLGVALGLKKTFALDADARRGAKVRLTPLRLLPSMLSVRPAFQQQALRAPRCTPPPGFTLRDRCEQSRSEGSHITVQVDRSPLRPSRQAG